ncbi:CRE-MUT-2 protein [Caenorhabditis remanei]|uniref:CRE-MUT-2 protein n=2 Tax=Caenorhabditis remanei TaxID=31234 RepID=E3LUX7_CAERE|nr:CRE-MUT-2 protein [Caenorhabditis remanei]
MTSNRDAYQIAYEVCSNLGSFHKFNERFSPVLDVFEDEFHVLSCNMFDYFDTSKQPEEEFNRKMNWCYQLKNIISKHNPTWLFNIVPTGSTVTGLATKNSDLDVAIHIPQAARLLDELYPQIALSEEERFCKWRGMQLEILQTVRLILEKDEQIKPLVNWEKGIHLVQAQIQILQIETADGIECDISVVMEPFLSSMHNSFMIRHYVHIDHRFATLCAVVKKWAASTGVKNPKDGGFNSYALVILVIHFLQCGAYPPILPNLSKLYKDDNFIATNDKKYPELLDFGAPLPRDLPKIQMNQASTAQLFLEFVHYYFEFDFQETYISMRDSIVKSRTRCPNETVKNEKQKDVYIEDPFDAHNPGRTVRSLTNIKRILRETLNMFIPPIEPTGNLQNQKRNFLFPRLDDIINMPSSSHFSPPPPVPEEEESSDVPSTSGIPPVSFRR